MKILPKMLTAGLVVSFLIPTKPVKPAVPLIIAPAVCAKVCVLVGTAVVGGVTNYIWQNRNTKKKYFADEKGRLIESREPELIQKGVYAEEPGEAIRRCLSLTPKNKRFVRVRRKPDVTGGFYYECTYQ